jgi:hypothetical protein
MPKVKKPLTGATFDDMLLIAEKAAVSDVVIERPKDDDDLIEVLPSAKPDISHLEDAIWSDGTTTVFIPQPGDRVVIERPSSLSPGNHWLDTKIYVVQDINDETGVLKLWDPELLQFAMSNFLTGPARGLVFKVPVDGSTLGMKRKRGRPRKNHTGKSGQNQTMGNAPKKRGRPKGSKNRPKEVIRAERLAATAVKRTVKRFMKKGAKR